MPTTSPPYTRTELRRRLPRVVFGLLLCGSGVGLMVVADLGLGPWNVFQQGLSYVTGISMGAASITVGVVVLLAWIPLRERPGLGTVLNVLIVGLTIDLVTLVVQTPTGLWSRTAMMIAGPLLFGIGSGFYLGAGLGSGPRDGIMTALARRGARIDVARVSIEVTVLAFGWFLGGTVGAGTVLYALGIGPLVHWSLPRLAVDTAR